jgi:predicted dinucleotide-binding enzyme
MKIGIIGSGNVGSALGARWAKNGHTVTFSSREPNSDNMKKVIAEAGSNAKAATVAEAVSASDIILLATPSDASSDAINNAGDLTGKILIDATNPVLPTLDALAFGNTTSAGEQIAQAAPAAKVVKAFNTVGANIMADHVFEGHKVVMFYAGDDASAKQTVRALIEDLGFDPQDAGPLTQSRVLEPFALLWITLACKQQLGRDIAFQLLRR